VRDDLVFEKLTIAVGRFAWLVVEADAELPGMFAWFSGFRFVRFVGKTSYGST
jgi:hypothetical protein